MHVWEPVGMVLLPFPKTYRSFVGAPAPAACKFGCLWHLDKDLPCPTHPEQAQKPNQKNEKPDFYVHMRGTEHFKTTPLYDFSLETCLVSRKPLIKSFSLLHLSKQQLTSSGTKSVFIFN